MQEKWLSFKSGTDVRGTALYCKPNKVAQLTDEAVDKIAKGFCVFLKKKLNKEKIRVALGYDSRLSARRIENAFLNACLLSGIDVIKTGLSSTPAMFMITQDESLNVDASCMITASHLPQDKNGLKFFTRDGGLDGKDIVEILTYAQNGEEVKGLGKTESVDYMKKYAQILVDYVKGKTGEEKPLQNLKIVVDAGNGAGGFYAYDVLKVLGADISGSQFLNPDGNFPNHIPNPENKGAMRSVCDRVREVGADFGIIFDTDVERAGAVDCTGEEINRNRLIALISAILIEEQPGACIVTDSVTSDGLTEFIESKGGVHYRFKRGYKNVIDESKRLNGEGVYSPLAIETSGHAAFKENYFLDDGAYLVTRLIVKLVELKKQGKTFGDVLSGLKMPKESAEIRMKLDDSIDFKEYGLSLLEKLEEYARNKDDFDLCENSFEGVRVSFKAKEGDGFFLLRMSLHEPIMPLNIESNKIGGTIKIAEKLYEFLKDYDKLNIGSLKNFLNK